MGRTDLAARAIADTGLPGVSAFAALSGGKDTADGAMMGDAEQEHAIHVALVTAKFDQPGWERVQRALSGVEILRVEPDDDDGLSRALQRADIAILQGDADPRFVAAPHLSWIHCGHAGIEQSADPRLFARGVVLTSAAGRSAPALAEHAIFLILRLLYDAPAPTTAQRSHQWGVAGYEQRSALCGKTVGIVGLGHTGRALVQRLAAFEVRLLGFRRRSGGLEGVDHVYSVDDGESIRDLLPRCDVVVLCVNLSDATRHLIGAAELAVMKSSAYLVNMGRGGLIDEPALIDALQRGEIAGAGLDTVSQEPLPTDSPLWDLPNVIITPHATPRLPDREERALDILLENIARYRRGAPLLNQISVRDQFTRAN